MEQLQQNLRSFRRRVRLVRAWRSLAVGGTLGAVVGVGIAVLDFAGVRYADWLQILVPGGIGGAIGFVVGLFWKVPETALADSIDRRAGLRNRLGTAIRPASGGAMDEPQRQDAINSLSGLKPSRVFPARFSKWHGGWVVLAGIAACLFLLGNTPLFLNDQQKKDRQDLKEAAKTIERVARPEPSDQDGKTPEEQKLKEEARKFAEALKRGRMTREEALQKANELSKKADELSKKHFEANERLAQEAKTALGKYEQQKLKDAGLDGADPQMMEASDEAIDAEAREIGMQISQLELMLGSGKRPDGKPMTEEDKKAAQERLKQLRDRLKKLELSKRAKDFLKKLYSMPEMAKIQELLAKAQSLAQSGKAGQPNLTDEQVKAMIKELEELAKKLGTEAEMRKFLQKLLESLQHGCGG